MSTKAAYEVGHSHGYAHANYVSAYGGNMHGHVPDHHVWANEAEEAAFELGFEEGVIAYLDEMDGDE